MTDDQKHAYIDQLEYANWMARGDTAAQAGQWDAALDDYTRACRISNTPDALDHMTNAARQIEDMRQARRAYDTALAAAGDSARAGRWDEALDLFRRAWLLIPTPEAKAGLDNARARLIAAARDRHALYLTSMAGGAAFARDGNWDRALDAYQQAFEIEPTPEARAAVAGAQKTLADRRQAQQRAYASAMAEAKSAIQAGNWAKALDAFTRAAALDDTREAANGIATARKKLAEFEANTRLYNAAMQEAQTSLTAGDWNKALAAHMRAAGIINTAEVQTAIAQDKKRLAEIQLRDQQTLYATAMADAATHTSSGQWKEALDAYRTAYQIQKTKEAAAGITQAAKMLTDAAYNKKQYDKALADAAAAVRSNDWTKALAAYQQAAAIDATAEAKAGVDRARQQIAAAAAAEKKNQYTQWMTAGAAAAKAGDWNKALGSYTKAAAVDNTPEVQAAIAGAQKQLTDAAAATAAAAEKKKQYTQLLTEGDTAAKAGDWQKALDSYTKAAAVDNTPAVQSNIANARTKLASASAAATAATDRKKQYDGLMADGDTAAKANDWQKALDSYTKAAALDNTSQAQAGVANARRQLATASAAAAAAEKKKQYDSLMADAAAAGKTGDWQKALDTYTKAAALDNTPEVKTAIADARKQLADVATAAAKTKQYTQFMADGDTAAKANSWQRALDAYTKAAALDNTPAVQTAIANAKAKLAAAANAAAAAAEKKRQYNQAMAEGDAAAKAGDWPKALDAYNRTAALDNTPEVQADVANAKAKLAAAAAALEKKNQAALETKTQYDGLMSAAAAAAKSGDWQKALDGYTKAAAVDNTAEVKTAIANARKQLADASASAAAAEAKKKQYTQFITDGSTAAKASSWQKALDAYTKAAALDDTPEAQAGITNAKNKLAAAATAADKKKLYDQNVSDGDAAGRNGDWQAALDSYNKAVEIDKTTAVQTKITNAKQKLYAKLMADGDAAAKANSWQKALDDYTKAAAVDNTAEVKAAIANAKKKLPGAN